MKEIVVGKMIRYFLTQKKMTMKELGNTIGKTESTVSKWVSGVSTPMAKDLSAMTYIFNTDINTLMYGGAEEKHTLTQITDTSAKLEEPRQKNVLTYAQSQLQEQNQNSDKIIQFPVKKDVDLYGIMTAGYGTLNDEKCQPTETISMPVDDIPRNYDIAFRISGNSMFPSYKDGDIVFVRKQTEIEQGMIGCVEINGEAFIKRVYIEEDGKLRLVSFNTEIKSDGTPLYPDRYATQDDDIYIIGKVVM